MIRFNELKIENNYIIIDVQIEEEKYFKDMYIDSIVIDTQDTFIANGPSSKAIYTKTFNTNTDINKEEIVYENDENEMDNYYKKQTEELYDLTKSMISFVKMNES